ncbi:hypothetical protein HZC27_02055 [Candidatus Roizmanbacteria bacterium]|nr:hypothetical protein [Candidatus Roizmanbacteria bacterium]
MGEKETGGKEIMVWGDDTREAYEIAKLNREIPPWMSYKQFKQRSEGNREYPKWEPYWSPYPNANSTSIPGRLIPKWLRRLVQRQRSGKVAPKK